MCSLTLNRKIKGVIGPARLVQKAAVREVMVQSPAKREKLGGKTPLHGSPGVLAKKVC